MRNLFRAVCIASLAAVTAQASSHREAPFITKNPKVDGTDFYAFNSYESGRAGFVTLIANYQPLQDAYGGPNYFSMDPEALYEIHIDNTGDGIEDLTFQFKFSNTLTGGTGIVLPITNPSGTQMNAIPLINAGAIGQAGGGFASPGSLQGVVESYTVTVVRGGRRSGQSTAATNTTLGGTSFGKPLDFVGHKTFPGNTYAAYANSFKYDISIPGGTQACAGKVFVGQRAESFAVNLGTIFDLVNADPSVITDPSLRGAVPNPIANKNVTSIALELPASCLTADSTHPVIGAWTTASVRQARVINPTAKYELPAKEGGAWVQVSRLGNPLVNEVVIGVPDKDHFNSSEPKDDLTNFGKYITNPTLPKLLNLLFGLAEPTVTRTDLVTAFGTGIAGVNMLTPGTTVAEYLRLNTSFAPTPVASQNNLGAAGCYVGDPPVLTPTASSCDVNGFPNGRRPGDDVVDIALRVMMGYLLPSTAAPSRAVPLHDAVLQDASQFDTTFPYLKTPNAGT
jgi:hypothetical protein